MDEDDAVEGGISRRTALKRIGVGAAVAWTAPVIMSVGDRAYGAPPGSARPCLNCTPCVNGQQPQCGTDAGGSLCFCVPTVAGACVCVGGTPAVSRFCHISCASSPCPSGLICVETCCDVYFPGTTARACFPPCV